MSENSAKLFNLPWHQYDQYWISVFAKSGHFSPNYKDALQQIGLKAVGDAMVINTTRNWKTAWDSVYNALQRLDALNSVEVSVISGATPPPSTSITDRKAPTAMQVIAESLWLGEALLENRILCYLQPVVNNKDKVFGYESFARVEGVNGEIIGGDAIVAASRALNMEFMIDRHLHVQAIKTFMASNFNGFLFINFFPGFIHRPEVYLEGLSATAKGFGIVAKHLVLEFTRAETRHDIAHLKNVCEYGRSRGYSIALDDIESLDGVRKLVPEIRPDFVKIDNSLTRLVADSAKRDTIRQILEFVHGAGGMIIAEGVETEEMYANLKPLGVDLFQGYHFSPPVPVEAVLKRKSGTR